MGDKTGIAWTDATWNPIRGCSRVSEGCRHCYAERQAARMAGPGGAYEGLVRLSPSVRWTGEVLLVPEKLDEPLRWSKPRRIFVNSMSDLFHEGLTDEQIAAVFGAMAASPRHTFQVLTKRAERMRQWFAWIENQAKTELTDPWTECHHQALMHDVGDIHRLSEEMPGRPWPLPNVHIGVSCEDQQTCAQRIPCLLATPAAVCWVSLEPLLGPVDIREWLPMRRSFGGILDWVVVGGESGPGARRCDTEWIERVVEECHASAVPVFVKQLGEHWAKRVGATSRHGSDPSEWPEALRVQEFPCAS